MTMSLLRTLRRCARALAAPLLLTPLLTCAPHALARPSPAADQTLAPYFVTEGGSAAALPLKSTRAQVTISGTIADVVVTQVYRNEGEAPLEARYVFPASSRAAVHALRLRVGERAVDAVVREKRQAQAEYAQARRERDRRGPALHRDAVAHRRHLPLRLSHRGRAALCRYRVAGRCEHGRAGVGAGGT